jgi:hypothetical protein
MAVPIVARGGFIVDNGTELPLDPFGRVRVAQPNTMYQLMSNTFLGSVNTKHVHEVCEDVVGVGATSSASESDSTVVMSVSSADSHVIRQSRQYIPYQPGKGRLIFMSGMLRTGESSSSTGVTSRIGIFDDFNPTEARLGQGHFFELSGTVLSVVERTASVDVSGNVIETRIPRSAWNGDRLDGTGPSKFTINLTRMQLYWIDMEWLGVGFVRFGVVHRGNLVICHTLFHSNELTWISVVLFLRRFATMYRMSNTPLKEPLRKGMPSRPCSAVNSNLVESRATEMPPLKLYWLGVAGRAPGAVLYRARERAELTFVQVMAGAVVRLKARIIWYHAG